MNEHLDPTGENFSNTERDIERKLRPLSFDDFTGQASVLENLKIFVEAAKMRDEAMDHVLLHGPVSRPAKSEGLLIWRVYLQTFKRTMSCS